ncbi:hypothetical protein [Paenibacillus shirakamiensis]|nr:hypothetical protein [Paenibacillus shirakamiensis]
MERSHCTASIQVKTRFPGGRNVGGKYSMNLHQITIYVEEIHKQCLRIFGSLDTYEEVLQIICAHEVGHACDPHLAELSDQLESSDNMLVRNRIALIIEENAWAYAFKLLPEANPWIMSEMMNLSLQAYRDAVEQESA